MSKVENLQCPRALRTKVAPGFATLVGVTSSTVQQEGISKTAQFKIEKIVI